jgi:hypothetical protein
MIMQAFRDVVVGRELRKTEYEELFQLPASVSPLSSVSSLGS